MAFKIPDLLQYELRHRLEQLQHRFGRWDPRGWINAHSGLVIGVTAFSSVLLVLVLVRILWPTGSTSFEPGRSVWFKP